jgi:hypothetical protein
MSRECYVEKTFTRRSEQLIAFMNHVIREYQSQGYVLTVRQLYYQLVARDVIETPCSHTNARRQQSMMPRWLG